METDAYDAAQSIFRGTFDLADIVFLIILLFLLLCSALASASEVAYFSLSPGELEKLKEIIQDESISIGKIKSTMKQVVPTYKEPEEVNKKMKENIKIERKKLCEKKMK